MAELLWNRVRWLIFRIFILEVGLVCLFALLRLATGALIGRNGVASSHVLDTVTCLHHHLP